MHRNYSFMRKRQSYAACDAVLAASFLIKRGILLSDTYLLHAASFVKYENIRLNLYIL